VESYARGDLVFDVRDAGPAQGPAAVLLHGFPQDASAFDAVLPALHDAGTRTLVPSLRGYGPGARPSRRRDYTTEQTAADVVALLDAAGIARAHLVGHDWGAVPAWALASWLPERVASLTVLSTPHPAALTASLVRSTQALRSTYTGFFQLPVVPEALLGRLLPGALRASGLPASRARAYAASLAEPAARTGALAWYRGMPLSRRPVGASRVPTTYLWGRRDAFLGPVAARLTADHVVGDYRFLPLEAGHWLPETRPAEVAAAVLERIGRP
jgi:pimeloyl-ACP methyl ester carboxylesterase